MEIDRLSRLVLDVVAETRGISRDRVTAESTFEDLGIDSIGALEILFVLEERVGVDVPEREAREIRTVGDVVRTFLGLISNGGKSPSS